MPWYRDPGSQELPQGYGLLRRNADIAPETFPHPKPQPPSRARAEPQSPETEDTRLRALAPQSLSPLVPQSLSPSVP
jgi:hypothetical protein